MKVHVRMVMVLSLIGLLIGLVGTTTTFAQGNDLPAGLIAWWSGDGDAESGLGTHHGTLHGSPSFTVGKQGKAFSLDGVDDYVSVGHDASLQPPRITVDLWMKSNTITTNPDWINQNRVTLISKGHRDSFGSAPSRVLKNS